MATASGSAIPIAPPRKCLSRAESNVDAEEIYFDLGGLLQVICEDARFEAQPRGVQVLLALSADFEDPDQAPLLKGAPQLLRRGIENVIRNALRLFEALVEEHAKGSAFSLKRADGEIVQYKIFV